MSEMVNVFLFGKKYSVPSNLTIMRAMEYAGYQLVRGCGCRNGFCGACATLYRIKGDRLPDQGGKRHVRGHPAVLPAGEGSV